MNDYSKIPESLRKLKCWCVWFKNEKGKIPVNARTLKLARVNDETTYSTYEEALATYERFKDNQEHKLEGLGFIFNKKISNVVGVDIDYKEKFKDTFESVSKDIVDIATNNDLNTNIYIESSQSSKGVHILLVGSLKASTDALTYKNRKDNLEIYDDLRFFALTGKTWCRVVNNKAIEYNNIDLSIDNSDIIHKIQDKYFSEEVKTNVFTFKRVDDKTNNNIDNIVNIDINTKSIGEILDLIRKSKQASLFNQLYNGNWQDKYESQSSADLAFCAILAYWFNRDYNSIDYVFRTSLLYREKWDEKHGSLTYGQMTISKAAQDCSRTREDDEREFQDKKNSLNRFSYAFTKENGEVVENINNNINRSQIEEKVANQAFYDNQNNVNNKNNIDFAKYDLNDTGNAQLIVDVYKDNIKYNFDRHEWMIYKNNKWCVDFQKEIKVYADMLIERLKQFSFSIADKESTFYKSFVKNIQRLSSSNGKDAMLKEATHILSVASRNKDYDTQDNLLNCNNCVIDLKTCEVLNHSRDLMLSKCCNIDIDFENYKEPKLWIKFLKDIFNNDEELIEYIQKAIGYTLTGQTNEQCLFFNIGNGSNGKSVLFNTIYNLLGDYASNIQIETLLFNRNSNGSSASPDIARLNNARFVRTTEASEGQRFNEGLIKQLTGNDVITARYLYADFFEFTPKFKLWIACNNRIIIRGTDRGIWRRIKSVDYTQVFEGDKIDKNLEEKLMQDKENILMWCILGAKKWYQEGLGECQAVNKSISSYKEEMDIITQFLNEKCVVYSIDTNKQKYLTTRTKASELFEEFKNFCKNGNFYMMTMQKFGIEMSKKFIKKVIAGSNYYYAVELKKRSSQFVFERKNESE